MFFTYTGIRVKNLEKSLNFYKKAMGMRIILKGTMNHGGVYVHLKSKNSPQRLELNYYPKGNEYYKPYQAGDELDHVAFWTSDVKRDYSRLIAKGAKRAVEPFREGRYQLAFVKDPDGIWIELIGKLGTVKKK
jgi:lactoylglutathione lyase